MSNVDITQITDQEWHARVFINSCPITVRGQTEQQALINLIEQLKSRIEHNVK